jgi:cytochrome c biogenesis protein CcmG, thiol:disulfide interchange protein DsbE
VIRGLQVLALATVVGLLTLLVWRVVTDGRSGQLVRELRAGKKVPAPQFALPVIWPLAETWPKDARRALTDGRLSVGELRGYSVVINFWASWCVPCKNEAPRLAASARAHSGKVAFVGIDVLDFASDARRFLTRSDPPYVSVHSGGGRGGAYDEYGLTGLPTTYWLDARGRIVTRYAGEISRRQLERGIDATMNAN